MDLVIALAFTPSVILTSVHSYSGSGSCDCGDGNVTPAKSNSHRHILFGQGKNIYKLKR